MANRTYLYGADSANVEGEEFEAVELLEASYCIPFLWLSLFRRGDIKVVKKAPVPVASKEQVIASWTSRKQAISRFLGPTADRIVAGWDEFIRTRDTAFFVLDTYELWLMENQEGELAAELSRFFNELDEICSNPRPSRDLAIAMQADRSVCAYPFEGKSMHLCGYTFESTVPWPDESETAPAQLLDSPRFRIEELAPRGVALDIEVKEALARAHARGLKPFVCISAKWCTPCLEMFESFAEPRMASTLDGIYLLKLDLEAWDRKFDGLRLPELDSIPVFFELGADGIATGRTIDGNAWEEPTAEVLAKVLTPFFQRP
jgi:hypothetical protein